MRKESGFDPHTHSYADAQGLLQMIPPTTRRVVRELDMEYTEDLLFDPELNIKTGCLVHRPSAEKIPRPDSHWRRLVQRRASRGDGLAQKNGDHPMDEFIELVSYSQTRNYMKRTPETYARYLYLYENKLYEQPLTVDPSFVVNDLTY